METWKPLSSKIPHLIGFKVNMIGEDIILSGGRTKDTSSEEPIIFHYNPSEDDVKIIHPSNLPLFYEHATCVIPRGRKLIISGGNTNSTNKLYEYSPGTKKNT